MSRLPLAIAFSLASLVAQDQPTPKAAGRMRIAGLQRMAAQWPDTKLGRLLADAEVAPAADKVLRTHIAELTRRRETLAAVIGGNYELDPWLLAWVLAGRFDPLDLLDTDVTETDCVEMLTLMVPDQPFAMTHAILRSCTPRHEGKWTQQFDAEAANLRASTTLKEVPDAKVDSFPAYGFTTQPVDGGNLEPITRWMMHLPGRFVRISGQSPAGVLAQFADRPAPGLSMSLDVTVTQAQFTQQARTPEEFLVLGFDKLDSFEWRLGFAGEQVLDEILAVTNAAPTGLIGAVVNGSAALPQQPLPEGALAQLRCALHIESAIEPLSMMAKEFGVPPQMLEPLARSLTGGVALGICAPAPGGLIPRVHLSLGIADRKELDALIAQLIGDQIPHKSVEYEGVACTVLQLPDVPNGLQPSFGVVGDTLHLCESPRTLRKFLQLLEGGDEAMAIGDTAAPDGPGELQPTLDLRFDEVAIYRAFYDVWLPLLEVTLAAANMEMVLQKDDLPDPDTFAEHCGFGRGVLRHDGMTWRLQQQGTFGGVETLVIALLWGPLIAAQVSDGMTDNLAQPIARQKLAIVQAALEAFEKREQRRPKDLAELFAAQRLPTDALLLPGDDLAEPVQLANGKTTRSSFRYFAEPVQFDGGGERYDAVLIQIRTHRYQRSVLTAAGVVQQDYSGDARKPIDAFGAGEARATGGR